MSDLINKLNYKETFILQLFGIGSERLLFADSVNALKKEVVNQIVLRSGKNWGVTNISIFAYPKDDGLGIVRSIFLECSFDISRLDVSASSGEGDLKYFAGHIKEIVGKRIHSEVGSSVWAAAKVCSSEDSKMSCKLDSNGPTVVIKGDSGIDENITSPLPHINFS